MEKIFLYGTKESKYYFSDLTFEQFYISDKSQSKSSANYMPWIMVLIMPGIMAFHGRIDQFYVSRATIASNVLLLGVLIVLVMIISLIPKRYMKKRFSTFHLEPLLLEEKEKKEALSETVRSGRFVRGLTLTMVAIAGISGLIFLITSRAVPYTMTWMFLFIFAFLAPLMKDVKVRIKLAEERLAQYEEKSQTGDDINHD